MSHDGSVGSTWRKWDLHIHSPASLVSHYPGQDPWDTFLSDLEGLPPEMSVIGINDYWFVDGYARVLKELNQGRLKNIEAVFPVVEMRVSPLSGTDGQLKRINMHAIFEAGVDPDFVKSQFVLALSAEFRLETATKGVTWANSPTRDNIVALGHAIRKNIPEARQGTTEKSDLLLGFNNLIVERDQVLDVLNRPHFKHRHLTAVGKVEWAAVKWNHASIGVKRDIINACDLLLVASPSPAQYAAARESLANAGVKDHLLDCSDAHYLSSSPEKDRIGNCFTWISAEPTLAGLKHAVVEFDSRVFVGDRPPKMVAVDFFPGKHIRHVSIKRSTLGTPARHNYFDVDLTLNPGFVAVIGNKGKGKSALLDLIGLAGNSSAEDHFSFLNARRFRRPVDGFADDYRVTLTWENNTTTQKGLAQQVDPVAPQLVTYLPQNLIDEICSGDPSAPADRFGAQLKQVLFAHVPEADRLGSRTLDELIEVRTAGFEERLLSLRENLSDLNTEIVRIKDKLRPERRASLAQRLALLERHLEDLLKAEAPTPTPPGGVESPEGAAFRTQLERLAGSRAEAEEALSDLLGEDAKLAVELSAANQLLQAVGNLKSRFARFAEENLPRALSLNLDIKSMLDLRVNLVPLNEGIETRTERRTEVAAKIEGEQGLRKKLSALKEQATKIEEQMAEPERKFRMAIQARTDWERAVQELQDGTLEEDGVRQVKASITELDELPQSLDDQRTLRVTLAREIHRVLGKKVAVFEELYGPARQFIDESPLAAEAGLEFGASLSVTDLEPRLWSILRRNTGGTFQGTTESSAHLQDMVAATDFDDEDSAVAFTARLDDAIHRNQKEKPPVDVDPSGMLRQGKTIRELYDLAFDFTYLTPDYFLQSNGTPINQLSPGQKGNLLLMFYLLIDPGREPLLLDQPDENLDNQTIKELLVPAIKIASARRQVILVTHSPNVAVVADADQVIRAEFDGDTFTYVSGAIEDRFSNEQILNILEGKRESVDNRVEKYSWFPDTDV